MPHSKYEVNRKGAVCPECGGYKWHGAKRCRKCKDGPPKTSSAGHQRATRIYRNLGTCEYEGCDEPARDRHHVDGDGCNNARENIAFLCRRHHMEVDGRLERFIENAPKSGWFTPGHAFYGKDRQRDERGRFLPEPKGGHTAAP